MDKHTVRSVGSGIGYRTPYTVAHHYERPVHRPLPLYEYIHHALTKHHIRFTITRAQAPTTLRLLLYTFPTFPTSLTPPPTFLEYYEPPYHRPRRLHRAFIPSYAMSFTAIFA